MSSGHKRIKFNTRERTVSQDHQRAQSFLAADRAEALRHLLNMLPSVIDRPYDDGNALLIGDRPTTVADPLGADVYEGLVVTPLVGSIVIHVSPGVVGMQDPDGQAGSSDASAPSADDSSYKIVVDPGLQDASLRIDPNAGPGARIDVVECRRNPNVVEETDTRDIFSLPLGTFVSTPGVEKVEAGRLEFQVRKGTAGNGFPGTVQGWLPIAVAHVPAGGGVTTDDVDFWDVRPLVSDRVVQPHRSSWEYSPAHGMQQLYGDAITAPGSTLITGHFWGQIGGVRAGGKISMGIPGVDVTYIDALDVNWWEPAFTVGANGLYYLWLLFPFGLPRWVRHVRTPIGGLRFPKGMRGIPVISATGPDGQSHGLSPATTINIPASTGLDPALANSTSDVVCVVAAAASALDTPDRFLVDGDWVELNTGSLPPVVSPPSNGSGNVFDRYDLVAGTHFPRNARAVRCVFECEFTGVNGVNLELDARIGVHHAAGNRVTDVKVVRSTHQFSAVLTNIISITADISRIPEASGLGAGMGVRIDWGAVGATGKANEALEVIGWRQLG